MASISKDDFKRYLTRAVEPDEFGPPTIQMAVARLQNMNAFFASMDVNVVRSVLRDYYGLKDSRLPYIPPPPAPPPRPARRFRLEDDEPAPPPPAAAAVQTYDLCRCTICGAYWRRWPDSWSRMSPWSGACCDNVSMDGGQIRVLAERLPWLPADSGPPPMPAMGMITPGSTVTVDSGPYNAGAIYRDAAGLQRTTEPDFSSKPPRAATGRIMISREAIEASRNAPPGVSWKSRMWGLSWDDSYTDPPPPSTIEAAGGVVTAAEVLAEYKRLTSDDSLDEATLLKELDRLEPKTGAPATRWKALLRNLRFLRGAQWLPVPRDDPV